MILYPLLGCEAAATWLFALLPMLAGLGVYALLRSEGVGRVGAFVGGAGLAFALVGSKTPVSLPFSGTFAWSALMLAAASRFTRARTWPGRIGWLIATAVAWGQLAAAHLSDGLVLGTALLVLFLVARAIEDRKAKVATTKSLLLANGLLLAALPLVNLAYLAPRLAYIRRSTLGIGYEELQNLAAGISNAESFAVGPGSTADWIFKLAASPGLYLGAVVLVLSGAAWWSRRRALTVSCTVFGVVTYLLSLDRIAHFVYDKFSWVPLVDFYLHAPARMRMGTILVLPMLAGLGAQALRERRLLRHRLLMLGPGLILWVALPLTSRLSTSDLSLLLVATAATLTVLALGMRWPIALALLALIVSVELSVNVDRGEGRAEGKFLSAEVGLPMDAPGFRPMPTPHLGEGEYARITPIHQSFRELGEGRHIVYQLGRRHWKIDPRSTVFGTESAEYYNPIQSRRYWTYMHSIARGRLTYQMSDLLSPSKSAIDLLDIRWIVAPSAARPPGTEASVAEIAGKAIYPITATPARATVVGRWTVVSEQAALDRVSEPNFDPNSEVLLEQDPGIEPRNATGLADHRRLGNGEAVVEVDATAPALVLIRTPYDPHWHATVDGESTSVLAADYLMQAVPVPAGQHTITLTYDDPWIERGLLGSFFVVAGLTAVGWALRRRANWPRGDASESGE